MKIIEGKFNTAKVFTDVFDETCEMQIRELLDRNPFQEAKIRIMPDCHAGASCVVGFTADFGDKVIPNIVGVDRRIRKEKAIPEILRFLAGVPQSETAGKTS